MARPLFYQTSYSRHLHSLVQNGFFARDLDADDHAFLESVRERGTANSTLPSSNTVLIEELEFWHLPYAIDHAVPRRHGPVSKRVPESSEQRAARLARTSAWHARRVIRQHENAIAAAELERERRDWEAAKETRKLRAMLTDAEWAAAAPRKRKFGKVVNRHYVPQWQLDEQRNAVIERTKAKLEAKTIRRAKAEEEAQAKLQAEQERRKQILEDARKTIAESQRAEREWNPHVMSLKRVIIAMTRTMARNNPAYVWTFEALMNATGCTDPELLNVCLTDMVHEGQLKKSPMPVE